MGAIVVGVDGSPGAAMALDWAIGEARIRRDRLVLVHVWHVPASVSASEALIATADWTVLEEAARQVLHASAARVLDQGADMAVEVEEVLVQDQAARALLRLARGADLLVLGTRGRGGFKGLLLGSVSQAVSHHAPCPVVIVPSTLD